MLSNLSEDAIYTIILIIVFSIVLITMLIYLWMKKSGKEIKRWFKILMFFILLIGVRHLNPLRWPDAAIRAMILNLHTPIGMRGEEVTRRIDNRHRWHRITPPRDVYFEPGRRGVSASLGRYRMYFVLGVQVQAGWLFDEDGYLIDVAVQRILLL